MSDLELESVIKALEDAFGHLRVPAEETLVYDTSGYHLECNEVQKKFSGRHWRDLTTEELRQDSQALFFLSPEGFRFLVPAFVRASILDYDCADMIPAVVVDSLREPEEPVPSYPHQARLRALTSRQRLALRDSLSLMLERHSEDFSPGEIESAMRALSDERRPD